MRKKVNNNLKITSTCSTLYLCSKIIPNPIILFSMEGFPLGFPEVFHFQIPRLGFPFLPPAIDQWLIEGRCDISAELMSIGFSRPKFNVHFEKIMGNQVGEGAFQRYALIY